jgi:phage regulator Rha-like protein
MTAKIIPLTQVGNEARVDSRLLAEQLNNKHKSSMVLIDRYADRFKQFGVLAFEMSKPKPGSGGGRPERYALLNEDQAYFLLALSRNTYRVVDLKASLIMAFREARYAYACMTLAGRKKEASQSGRRLAHWRYDKPGMQEHVAHLREQLCLPIDVEAGA